MEEFVIQNFTPLRSKTIRKFLDMQSPAVIFGFNQSLS